MSADTGAREPRNALRYDAGGAVYWSLVVCAAAWFIHETWPWGFLMVPPVAVLVVLRRKLLREGIEL